MLTQKIKNELENLGIKPKKSLGQNFLINEMTYQKIVDALEIKKGETIVEVGPGLGTLTEFLVKSGANIIAIEKSRELAAYLKNKFSNYKNIKILEDDVLEIDLKEIIHGNYKLVGNIPYYITSHLIRTVLENWPTPEMIIFMVQKEVAQRIVAKPPEMSLLAVSVQYYAQAKIVSHVSKSSFYPQPNVDSAIIKLSSMHSGNNSEFFRIVKAGFSKKRKQLANNLTSGLKIKKEMAEQKLNSAGIDPKRRAETLTIQEWQKLTDILAPQD